MSFYYFRLRVAAVFRPICLILSMIACCLFAIPGSISGLDSFFKVESPTPKNYNNLTDISKQWKEILELGDISRHHRLAEKKTALWWSLVEFKDIQSLESALKKKEKKAIKHWLDKNKRNLEMQLAYQVWVHRKGDHQIAIKRIKNLAKKFPEFNGFAKQYRLWTKKKPPSLKRIDDTSIRFMETR